MITLHNLKVYEKAVMFAATAEKLSMPWGHRHSVVDHFCRASESIVINIAEGARLLSSPLKVRTLDYAIGSSLECAACLDIARIKDRLSSAEAFAEKTRLSGPLPTKGTTSDDRNFSRQRTLGPNDGNVNKVLKV